MFLWIGCKLPEAYEQEIRSHCLQQNQKIGLDTTVFSLPQHISLKISFETEQVTAILQYLTEILSAQASFSVRLLGAEQFHNILWIPVDENERLWQLHRLLDTQLEERFAIEQHEYDKCFQFHSTLFIDPDPEKIATMAAALASYPIERELTIDTFLLGLSETGKAGSFQVVRELKI